MTIVLVGLSIGLPLLIEMVLDKEGLAGGIEGLGLVGESDDLRSGTSPEWRSWRKRALIFHAEAACRSTVQGVA